MVQGNAGISTKEHLYEVDLMRAFIIFGVIVVHVISFFDLFTTPASGVRLGYDLALVAFHFTREAFMFITGVVLFIVYYRRKFSAWGFWSKRFKLVLIPYLAWNLLYVLFSGTYLKNFSWEPLKVVEFYVTSVFTGNQFYIYYLLISMQLYIVFPLFVPLMRKLEKYHVWVLIASFLLEIALMWLNKAYIQNLSLAHMPQWLALLIKYRDRNILSYQFWFVSGAIIAAHYQSIKQYLIKHPRMVFGSVVVALAVLWAHLGLDRSVYHQDETMLVLVLQPIMVPFSAIITVALWAAGMQWAKARLEPRVRWFSRFVKVAAAGSFGIFLIQPFTIHYMEIFVYNLHTTEPERLVILPFAIAWAYFGSLLIARGIARIPILSYIVGQKSELPKWATHRTRVSQTS